MTTRALERGLTLTEVTIVVVLASIVMTGLVAFYLNAQTLWIDASAQAITQREVSLALSTIAKRARRASFGSATGNPTTNLRLQLDQHPAPILPADPESSYCFWLDTRDSLLHSGYANSGNIAVQDFGPVMNSRVTLFAAHADQWMVYVDSLRALTPQGHPVTMSTSIALMNRP